eukprot:gene16020-biopygen5872
MYAEFPLPCGGWCLGRGGLVQCSGSVGVKIRRNTALKKLMDAYCKKQGVGREDVPRGCCVRSDRLVSLRSDSSERSELSGRSDRVNGGVRRGQKMRRFLKSMKALKMMNMLNGMYWRGCLRTADEDAGDAEPDEGDEFYECPRAHASALLMIRTHYS